LFGLPLSITSNLQGIFVGDLNRNILLLESWNLALDLVCIAALTDVEAGAERTLALLSLAVCLPAGFAVEFSEQLIDLAQKRDERWERRARNALLLLLAWGARERAAGSLLGGCEAGCEEECHCFCWLSVDELM
jgi:hypothetical protein